MTFFAITRPFLDQSFSSSNSTEILMRQFCVENFMTIGWTFQELSCKRPDGRPARRTHWPILECTHFLSTQYSLFEYTKRELLWHITSKSQTSIYRRDNSYVFSKLSKIEIRIEKESGLTIKLLILDSIWASLVYIIGLKTVKWPTSFLLLLLKRLIGKWILKQNQNKCHIRIEHRKLDWKTLNRSNLKALSVICSIYTNISRYS